MAFRHAYDGDSEAAGKWEVCGRIVRATQKAILLDDGTRSEWLPLSKITREENRDGTTTVYMPEWLAKEKGFI